jgi:hypothetical protein
LSARAIEGKNTLNKEDLEKITLETRYLSEKVGGLISKKNWLGGQAGSGAAQVNALLLVGATMEQLEACRGGVRELFHSLRTKYGLEVFEEEGIFKFKL